MHNKKILLVFPSYSFYEPNSRPPLGVSYIAAVLLKNKYEVKILDLTLYKFPDSTLRRTISDFKPEVVAFSVLTTTYPAIRDYIEICQREVPTARIILGGPHPTATPDTVLIDFPEVFLVRGEGEITISELIHAWEGDKNIENIKGISFCKNGKIIHAPPRPFTRNLDSFPFPALALMEVEKYEERLEGQPILSLVTSRGCPFRCVYCLKPTHGRRWVGRSPENIIAEIDERMSRYNVRAFYFVDDLFPYNHERVLKFCHLLRKRNIDIIWECLSRVDIVSRKLLQEMSKSGCRLVHFGIESCDDRILGIIKKDHGYEEVVQALTWAKESGLKVKAHMMLALPGDTGETMFRTIERIINLSPDDIQFNITIPYPHTELWKMAEEQKILSGDYHWDFYQMSNIERMNFLNGKEDYLPIFLPPDFTKREIAKLCVIANNMVRWKRFKNDLRTAPGQLITSRVRYSIGRTPSQFILISGSRLIRFLEAALAKYRYKRFKLKKLNQERQK